jgi:DNA-binding transcriptional MerR regulator
MRVKVAEASAITGITVGTLRFWRHTNQGPKSYTIGNRLYYDVADLDDWLAAEKAKSVRGSNVAQVQVSA